MNSIIKVIKSVSAIILVFILILPVNSYASPQKNPWAKKGYGTAYLSQVGKMENAKFSFKYAHNAFGATPSVSYPWGVSFGFQGAEYTYLPDEIVNSQKDF
ncbi:hypothetical protein [Vallitalea sp.]|jgi:hypothetical protein|uniref:hypothetical protein n=1 Tax=Vallitalea sp. TaxID=1882829 RepID=UPI0025EFD73F|nr:hypothetical protein [Vallitalea sp.]MCT4686048.1 hypothetical protein [Vallitalea sp.]